jgi:hypothetical protein
MLSKRANQTARCDHVKNLSKFIKTRGILKYIQNLTGKPEDNRPLDRPRHKWDDNIKTHLQEKLSQYSV